ncbi:MAG: hypothetical protein V4671_29585 [Armatimonadota bacterium]
MSGEREHSILGGWLGTYYYRRRQDTPVRFEATFSSLSGNPSGFGGTILDDIPIGEAVVTHGLQTGPNVRFTKTYRQSPPESELGPYRYLGTLSEDGRHITGTWETQFRHRGKLRRMSGSWDARRLWEELEEQESESLGSALNIQLLSR